VKLLKTTFCLSTQIMCSLVASFSYSVFFQDQFLDFTHNIAIPHQYDFEQLNARRHLANMIKITTIFNLTLQYKL